MHRGVITGFRPDLHFGPKMFMGKWKPISVASRMACKLVLLSTFTLTVVHLLGIIPNPKQAEIRRKTLLCETLAITSSLLAQRHDNEIIKTNLSSIIARHPDVLSACIRQTDGTILHQIGEHSRHWHLAPHSHSTRDNIYVPITSGGEPWGTVEISFTGDRGFVGTLLQHPIIVLGVITACLNGLIFHFYLKRAFAYLDPTKSVPMHVRSTLDAFSEGVIVLDNDRRIVLANDKFRRHVGKTDHELLGKEIDHLPWQYQSSDAPASLWQPADPAPVGTNLGLQLNDERRTYLVNTSAIVANDGQRRGTIASFDDITPLEQKREELSKMLQELQVSRDKLKLRNKELQYLATRDPLTDCLNRRSFFEAFDNTWHAARRYGHDLCCCMVDVDYFKSVNDDHGHSMGDEVLRRVSKAIRETVRNADIVCRYGGEEFCVLLPQVKTDEACQSAERIRHAIAELDFETFSVTASLGVSSLALGATEPQELLDQADKCLYSAKRTGRNRVVRWDDIASHVDDEESAGQTAADNACDNESDTLIPYPAVASLLSALAYRDADTAAHSTRVAELCVATARGLMSLKEAYVLEIGALLHDIGKIGVPDAILLKPGPLTREEWETMEIHDRIGVEIVEASFANRQLVDILRYHHATYGGSPDAPQMPTGKDIPLGARIVTIVDAYDAMVSDRVYRKGRSQEKAFEELRRCAGRQFDPDLVERFIAVAKDYQSIELPVSSKQTAVQIGLQIERLAQAVDDRDDKRIKALAARLEATAARARIPEIEAVAAEIKESADDDRDLLVLLEMVNQLINLCRSTQKIYVNIEPRKSASEKAEPELCLAGGKAVSGERRASQEELTNSN